jgi:hypothetical protein
MRINDELVHSRAHQMIERESDQRLLKDRNERLWQLVRQRTQTDAEPSAQNECLCDFVHEKKNERSLDFAGNDKKNGRNRVIVFTKTSCMAGKHEGGKRPTLNQPFVASRPAVMISMLRVRCWAFDVFRSARYLK